MAHTALPIKLRLRTGCSPSSDDLWTRRRLAKRSVVPQPDAVHKRRRCDDDEMASSEDESCGETELRTGEASQQDGSLSNESEASAPSTPKRARIAPEVLPLGLERSDFHNVYRDASDGGVAAGLDFEFEADAQDWTAEDDRVLVELVLEKLKLSKSEWQECARNLGKDRHDITRRWKSLMMKDEVGLKTRSNNRRPRLHSTWS